MRHYPVRKYAHVHLVLLCERIWRTDNEKEPQMTVALATGAPSASLGCWTSIDWTVVYKHVHRLQMRIAKAVEQERWHKVAALSRILTRSYYAKLWAVRRVVTNKGNNICRSYDISRFGALHTPTIPSMPNISSSGVTDYGCVERGMVSSWQLPLLSVWFDV